MLTDAELKATVTNAIAFLHKTREPHARANNPLQVEAWERLTIPMDRLLVSSP